MLGSFAEKYGSPPTIARPPIFRLATPLERHSVPPVSVAYNATVSSAGTQIQFKEALLKLEVTPTVIREGDISKIKMLVVVENNGAQGRSMLAPSR